MNSNSGKVTGRDRSRARRERLIAAGYQRMEIWIVVRYWPFVARVLRRLVMAGKILRCELLDEVELPGRSREQSTQLELPELGFEPEKPEGIE